MLCNKCNHTLPDDSEFCQYCGKKIETLADSVMSKIVNNPDMSSEDVLDELLEFQAKATIEAMDANSKKQPDLEDNADFGLVPEKPIYTHALKSVDGEVEYLNKLYTTNGEKIKWTRRGSTGVSGVNGMIDIYDTFLPSGQFYKTIYINMYGAKTSSTAPKGFYLRKKAITKIKQKSQSQVKIKFCSRCGNAIDNTTKICTGCGKKYFKGISLNKMSVSIIILTVIIAVLSFVCVLQFINKEEAFHQITDLKQQLGTKESTINILEMKNKNYKEEISGLEQEIDELELDNLVIRMNLEFYRTYAVLVNENSKKYHVYNCEDFDESSFWIYNVDAAEQKGYYACPKCH